ncbi:hypothetical protein GW537_19175 (plasmid) [Piscirickettsia salmonis]|uniref:hypothetical protein n=1 Tax=Piscirickettsia salmonis TaxID=1238 RepID=UPI00137C037F|nr:hypothetical protein [Piscirickettsia salmonis]QHS31112.1 hypothetical protein GW537_19175 [Piscirickettsia salmonis]
MINYWISCLILSREHKKITFLKLTIIFRNSACQSPSDRKRRYLGRYFAHPMMQNREQNATTINLGCPRHTALRALNRHTPYCALT